MSREGPRWSSQTIDTRPIVLARLQKAWEMSGYLTLGQLLADALSDSLDPRLALQNMEDNALVALAEKAAMMRKG